jgi:hypothetical protein
MAYPPTSTTLSGVLLLGVGHATRTTLGYVKSTCVPSETIRHDATLAYCRGRLSPTYFASTNLRLPGSRSRAEQRSKLFFRHQHTDDSVLH